MRTTDFSQILTDTLQLCGLDRDEFNLPTFKQIRDLINARLRMCWEYDTFPDLMRLQQVNILTDGNTYYFVKPALAGEIFSLWYGNPFEGTRAIRVDFAFLSTNDEDRIIVGKNYTDPLYLEYRIQPPVLNGLPWDNSLTYKVGSQVYFDKGSATGNLQQVDNSTAYSADFYTCVSENTNSNPSTTEHWTKVKIPYIFSNYLARAAFSDYLRTEAQFDSARIVEVEANSMLDLEIDKIARQQGQIGKYNFINTH